MYHVKTMNKISKIGLAELDDRFEISDTMEHEDAILVRSAKLHDYDFPAELLCIARAGAGVNNIPLDRAAEAGIVVFNTPGANANGVKELTIAALLLASRKISQGITWVKEQAAAGADVAAVEEMGKAAYVGPEIQGKTLGVVGLGAIGVLVANAAAALGMQIVGYDPFLSVQHALNLTPGVKVVSTLEELYGQADYISLHLPMTPETKGTLNDAAFAAMKDGVRIVNLARGERVDTEALKAALASGKCAAYVTDFPTAKPPPWRVWWPSPPGRLHPGERGQLRHDGRPSGERLPGQRQHCQLRESSRPVHGLGRQEPGVRAHQGG
ncbi:MAG: 3-phosphoglycerate dehydrogenase [Evtepia gabavorous]